MPGQWDSSALMGSREFRPRKSGTRKVRGPNADLTGANLTGTLFSSSMLGF